MTRKKFVKQVMALGYQRNEAERLAEYARRGFWTYEQYLEIEKKYHGMHRKFESIKISCVDHLAPEINAAAKAMKNLCKIIEEAVVQTPYGRALLDWTKENAPQITERHPADALDALTYNMQIMSRADHDALHGYVCGIDLANGPDFTAGGGGHD